MPPFIERGHFYSDWASKFEQLQRGCETYNAVASALWGGVSKPNTAWGNQIKRTATERSRQNFSFCGSSFLGYCLSHCTCFGTGTNGFVLPT